MSHQEIELRRVPFTRSLFDDHMVGSITDQHFQSTRSCVEKGKFLDVGPRLQEIKPPFGQLDSVGSRLPLDHRHDVAGGVSLAGQRPQSGRHAWQRSHRPRSAAGMMVFTPSEVLV